MSMSLLCGMFAVTVNDLIEKSEYCFLTDKYQLWQMHNTVIGLV